MARRGLPRKVGVEKQAGLEWEGFYHVRSLNITQRREGRQEANRSCGKVEVFSSFLEWHRLPTGLF